MVESVVAIGDILVSADIFNECFCCDYKVCHGACCVIGDSGAPMSEDECETLERDFEKYRPLMTEEGLKRVSEVGFFEIDVQGDIVTPLVSRCGACAFAQCEGSRGEDVYCTIERCGAAKPISCSLYPIRVSTLGSGMTALNYHKWEICASAVEKGRKEGVKVYQFLERPLRKAFGDDFYEALEACDRQFSD